MLGLNGVDTMSYNFFLERDAGDISLFFVGERFFN